MRDVFRISATDYPEQGKVVSHPEYEKRYLRSIEVAVRHAWHIVVTDPARTSQLANANENTFTDWLLDELHALLMVGYKGYSPAVFERPHMGSEFLDLSLKRRKKPDINFGLCGAPRTGVRHYRFDYIFAECKLLNMVGKANIAAYLNEGVSRFVLGSYAWAMREGMMIAYVRSSQTLPTDLLSELIGKAGILNCNGKATLCGTTQINPRVYITSHDRHWSYPDSRGIPGPIRIRHLWLHVY